MPLISLRNLTRRDAERAGGKAATLGELAAAGFPVPDGFVVVGAPDEEVLSAAEALGGPWAVRSSASAEDLSDASFAGQYETVLDVSGRDALLRAIETCRRSGAADRVAAYRARRGVATDGAMAVLVQRMVRAEAAGVAFTANPITGDRDEVVITAARGLGERVVSGEATGDEWRARDGRIECVRDAEHALDASGAAALADLCRRIQSALGGPQDVEWAMADGRFHILQARPMTALVEPVQWSPPTPGHWTRTFRIGEWLHDPMTPLFEDWLLERLESGYLLGMKKAVGASVPFRHASVNGWYYIAPPPNPPAVFLRAALASRGRVFSFIVNALIRVGTNPELADRRLLGRLARAWREDVFPRYERAVAAGSAAIGRASRGEIVRWVDEIGTLAGKALWSLAIVGGSAWKMEGRLAKFLKQHVPGASGDQVQALLSGLPGTKPSAGHGVVSLDWFFPTLGEVDDGHPTPSDRRAKVAAERERVTDDLRRKLEGRALQRFETLLEVAQRYTGLREEQSRMLTLGWPLLRQCALRLGDAAVAASRIQKPEDAFFLRREELLGTTDQKQTVLDRRSEWERRRKLIAPLMIGTPSRIFTGTVDAFVEAMRAGKPATGAAIVGHPASPGRAEGIVRVIHGADEFDQFAPGEVLVARGTTPAWTPLFARAAAVVTDGGSLAAHASLVAREYGIPAVVGTGDATVRLRTGQRVLVDGSAGTVEPAG